jgi:hypothetical protein
VQGSIVDRLQIKRTEGRIQAHNNSAELFDLTAEFALETIADRQK